MRHLRIITAAVAAVAALLLALGSASGASAHTAAKVLPAHTFTSLTGGKVSGHHYYIKGNVTTAKGRKIVLQKARKGSGNWRYKATTRTALNSGFFRFDFYSLAGFCYRVVVPATPTHRKTIRNVGCVVRT
ncbi:hypothetical protein GCM10028801_13550 [Nocardioides maradonensis]